MNRERNPIYEVPLNRHRITGMLKYLTIYLDNIQNRTHGVRFFK
jgi:hypothetical protein